MNRLQLLTASTAFLMIATACAPGAQLSTASGSANNSSNSGSSQSTGSTTPATGGSTTNPAVANWQNVSSAMDSSVNGGLYNQYPLIQINPSAQTIELLIPLPSFGLTVTPVMPTGNSTLSALQGLTIGPATLPDGSTDWAISVPLKYLLQNYNTGLQPLGTLPNGSALPDFPSEQVDGIAVSLPGTSKYQIYVYVGLKAVAAFVAIPGINIPIGLGYSIVNQAQTRNIGYLGLVPTIGNYAGGVYVAAQIPTDVSLMLNSLVSF